MEKRFYINLEVFFNKDKEYCMKLSDEVLKDNGKSLTFKGKSFKSVMEYLTDYMEGYYDILEDIEKTESEN